MFCKISPLFEAAGWLVLFSSLPPGSSWTLHDPFVPGKTHPDKLKKELSQQIFLSTIAF